MLYILGHTVKSSMNSVKLLIFVDTPALIKLPPMVLMMVVVVVIVVRLNNIEELSFVMMNYLSP